MTQRHQSRTPADRQLEPGLAVGLVVLPFVFVWLLLREGYSTLTRVAGFAWTAFAVFVVVTAPGRAPPPASGPIASKAPAPNPPLASPPEAASAAAVPTPRDAVRGATCGSDGQVTQLDFAVAREGPLLSQPRENAAPMNMRVGESEVPAPLEQQATVRELCRSGQWSEVRVLTLPSPLHQLQGWVRSEMLRPVSRDATGRRVYEAGDFDWPAGSAPHRAAAVRIMNRIMRERTDCDALDRQSLVMRERGQGRPVFSIPCFSSGEMVSFDFTSDDAAIERRFAR